MNETFNTCLELFKLNQSESLCEKTINRKVHEVNKLLLYIEAKGIQDFYNFSIQEIYNYINSLEYAVSHQKVPQSLILKDLNHFL